MQKAVYNLYGRKNVRARVLHSIRQGYFCKLTGGPELNEAVLLEIKEEMLRLAEKNIPLMKETVSTNEARAMFHSFGMTDKEQLFKYRRSSTVNIYDLDGYKDYFYGYMVASTGYLKYFDLKLYQDGFMLLYPNQDSRKVAEFVPSDQLFHTLDESSRWEISWGSERSGRWMTRSRPAQPGDHSDPGSIDGKRSGSSRR